MTIEQAREKFTDPAYMAWTKAWYPAEYREIELLIDLDNAREACAAWRKRAEEAEAALASRLAK